MGAAGLEPAKPGGARFTAWCDCRSATHPQVKDEGGRMRDESRITDYEVGCVPAAICFILHPSTFIPAFSRLVRESNPCLRLDRAPCFRYTNKAVAITSDHLRASAGIEPWPRHSQCRVLPLHQARHRSFVPAEEEGLEPSPPVKGAATFSKRVRQAGIRLSSES